MELKLAAPLSFALVAGLALPVASGAMASAAANRTTTLTVAYWPETDPPGTNATPNWLKVAAGQMQRLHPGVTVSLDPITTDSESEYYAKLDLAERSSRTTPDVVYEDSFLIGSDASAGYIRPLPALKSWSGWSKYYSPMQGIATYQGQIYGAMNSTDVQLIYYDANLFRKAGLPVPWQPRNWADVLHAAKELKAKDAGITPVWVYTGQALGEASSFRGFEIFLNGTNDRLFDNATNRWEVSGPGLSATWQFLANLRPYEEPESDWSSPNAAEVVDLQLMPAQQVGIVFDGSWVSDLFVKGSSKPWPGFFSDYREAQLPTETGQAPGFTNQSGGWALCVAEQSKNAALATEFIETASSAGDLATYDATAGNLPPRSDESSQPAWLYATTINPVLKFAADQIPYSSYRPGLPDYVQISNDIAVLTGEVSSGQVIAPDAAKTYESQVTAIVGARSSEHMAH